MISIHTEVKHLILTHTLILAPMEEQNENDSSHKNEKTSQCLEKVLFSQKKKDTKMLPNLQ